ncbi:hypothetical protein [Nocardioides sp.]|uniref:hypothetical protein n=1 Tax=Nocardioides sp. TaxID=35761 RepID=UPI0037837B44
MALTVYVPQWYLEEDEAVVALGDQLSTWLVFYESARWDRPPDHPQRLVGAARTIPMWPGAERGRHPTVIEVGGAPIYWDAPEPTNGPVEVTGTVCANDQDAPDDFPPTDGVVTRVRMVWQDYRPGENHVWYPVPGTTRYEDLDSSYLPHLDLTDPTARVVWTGVLVDLDVTGSQPS